MMGSVASGVDGAVAYTGMIDVVKRTVKTDGVLGLYRGIAPTCAGIMPYAGFGFAGMELFRSLAPKNEDGKISVPWKLACGALAGCSAQTASYPLDTIRRRMQLQGAPGAEKAYSNSLHCFRSILKNEGPKAFYRGLGANLLRAMPNTAIQFTTFEFLRSKLKA